METSDSVVRAEFNMDLNTGDCHFRDMISTTSIVGQWMCCLWCSVGQDEIDPIDENHADEGHRPRARPTPSKGRHRPPQRGPGQCEDPSRNEDPSHHRREGVDREGGGRLGIEQRERGPGRAAGRAGDSGDGTEGAGSQVRRYGDPQRPEDQRRDRSGPPEQPELPLLTGGRPPPRARHRSYGPATGPPPVPAITVMRPGPPVRRALRPPGRRSRT